MGETFRIYNVPLGHYEWIVLSTRYPNVRSVQPLALDGPIKDLRLSLAEREMITGRARYETVAAVPAKEKADAEKSAPPPTPSGVGLWFASPDEQIYCHVMTRTDKDGLIEAPAFPGRTLLLTVTPPAGSWVSRVIQGGKDVVGAPFEVGSSGGPIEVVLRNDTGLAGGSVRDKDGNPVRAFVVAAPKDRRREDLFRSAWSGSDGAFRLANMAPGEYTLIALDRNDEDQHLEMGYLDGFTGKSSPLIVSQDRTRSQDLVVVKP